MLFLLLFSVVCIALVLARPATNRCIQLSLTTYKKHIYDLKLQCIQMRKQILHQLI